MNNPNVKTIESLANDEVKMLKSLSRVKYRNQSKLFLVENLKIISDALDSGHLFDSLYYSADFEEKNSQIISKFKEKNPKARFFQISEKINKQCSQLTTASGIIALYKMKEMSLQEGPIIYLNSISDPGNLGTIIRSALAFGFINIVMGEGCVDLYNSKVISAAKEAIFKTNILVAKDADWLKTEIYNKQIPIYSTNAQKGRDVLQFKPESNYCLVLGSESHGTSEEIEALSSDSIRIEISKDIESLNVAIAASIIFHRLSE